jgi:hypothetical protein
MQIDERRQDVRAVSELRDHVDKRFSDQDTTLNGIRVDLSAHIVKTDEFKKEVKPALDAITTMQSGVRVIGWIGSKVAAFAAVLLAIFGAITAWHQLK